jgi:hypothetical protein
LFGAVAIEVVGAEFAMGGLFGQQGGNFKQVTARPPVVDVYAQATIVCAVRAMLGAVSGIAGSDQAVRSWRSSQWVLPPRRLPALSWRGPPSALIGQEAGVRGSNAAPEPAIVRELRLHQTVVDRMLRRRKQCCTRAVS